MADLQITRCKDADSSSPFRFLDLPGEIRNNIYSHLLEVKSRSNRARLFTGNSRGGPPAILRTCRKIHEEASCYLYMSTEFNVRIDVDGAFFRKTPNILSSLTPEAKISMMRNWHFQLCCHPAQIRTPSDLKMVQHHLRGVCIAIMASGARLESVSILVEGGDSLLLDHTGGDHDLLRPLKEFRVSDDLHVLSFDPAYTQQVTSQYIADVRTMMLGRDLPVLGHIAATHTKVIDIYEDIYDAVEALEDATVRLYEHVHQPADDREIQERLAHAKALLRFDYFVEVQGDPVRLAEIPLEKCLRLFEDAYFSLRDLEHAEGSGEHSSTVVYDDLVQGAAQVREWLYLRPEIRALAPDTALDMFKWL